MVTDEENSGVYHLQIINQGRTPAHILNWKVVIETFDHKSEPANEGPELTITKNLYTLLASDGVYKSSEKFNLRERFRNWNAALLGIETALISVTVEYRDLVTGSNLPHKTSFRYNFQLGNFERLSVYNEATAKKWVSAPARMKKGAR